MVTSTSKRARDEDCSDTDGPTLKRQRTSETELDVHDDDGGDDEVLATQIQVKRCQKHFREVPQQCVCCRRRKPGDNCRFIGIREFTLRGGVVVGRRFVSNVSETFLDLPGQWNTIPSPAQIITIKVSIFFCSYCHPAFTNVTCSAQLHAHSAIHFATSLLTWNNQE